MINIRTGTKDDLKAAMALIMELAEYENGAHEVTNTVEMMEEDGFGDRPVFYFILAEKEGKIVGLSLYYFRYSTWKGKRLFLEDLVVRESERGTGIGALLFEKTIQIAKDSQCTGMMWQVLDWNEPAINFYRKYQARLDEEWINCHLDF